MKNIAQALKAEITRLARKETKGAVAALRKAVSLQRTEIASLKKRAMALEKLLRGPFPGKAKPVSASTSEVPGKARRFGPKSLAAQRRRLGLSAAECGALIGASGQSVYNWESGAARPRAKHLEAISALKTLSKREAAARLAA